MLEADDESIWRQWAMQVAKVADGRPIYVVAEKMEVGDLVVISADFTVQKLREKK